MRNLAGRQCVASGLLTGFVLLNAWGFQRPERPPLPNVDNRSRIARQQRPAPNAAQLDALARLATRLPNVRVDVDGILAVPTFVTRHGGLLGRPEASADPHHPIKVFLDEYPGLFGHDSTALTAAAIKRDYVTQHNGMRTVVWQQQFSGLPVFEATLAAHVTRRGELINISSHFIPDLAKAAGARAPRVSAQQAIASAAANIGVTGNVAHGLIGQTQSKLVWLPLDRATLQLCWEVVLTSRERGEMYRVLVDAQTGTAVVRRCLTEYISDASYRVFISDSPSPFSPGLSTPSSFQPPEISRTLVVTGAVDTVASPDGWINDGDNTTLGNNVDAHLDKDADDIPDPGSRPTGSPFRVFDFAQDLAQEPVNYTNAVVVQLFYWNNWMHDKLYALGFTEAAGNFQANNFGRGGVSNDAVQADAQDGSGFNNANFSTPSDGGAGRMQMYIFNGPTPNRDGDLDAEIVLHEYGHGLSNRLVGGGVGISALQPRGMGEGWSDFYGLALLSEPADNVNSNYAAGGYATYQLAGLTENYYYGIRRYPYSTDLTKNPLTYKDLDPGQASLHTGIPRSPIIGNTANEVHNMGELWCVTLWEARANLINKFGFATGNQLILQLVTDGMKLSPANPTFLQARDAIIQADLVNNAGANHDELWAAFAKRGMGVSATAPVNSTTAGVFESFDIPDDLRITPATALNAAGALGGPFSPACQNYVVTNAGIASFTWVAAHTQAWLDVSIATATLAPGTATNVAVCINSNANALAYGTYVESVTFSNASSGAKQTRAATLNVQPPTIFLADFEDGSGGYSPDGFSYEVTGASSNLWHPTTHRAVSPTHSQYFGREGFWDYDNGLTNAGKLVSSSISLAGIAAPITLSFKYFLVTENFPPYDAALVEISTNAGSTWITLATLADAATFTTLTFDISAHAGKNLLVRFTFDTMDDILNFFEGWYVDDVEVRGPAGNQPPVVSSAQVLPGAPATTNDLVATIGSASDADDDPITFAYQWQHSTNDVVFTAIVGQVAGTLGAASTVAGDYYRVSIIPNDGFADGAPFVTDSVLVALDFDGDGLNDDWEVANFGSLGAQTGSGDPDGDGFTNAQELFAGTDPNDAGSAPLITAVTPSGADVLVSFRTVAGKQYELQRCVDLLGLTWDMMQTGIAGTGGIVQITDPGAASLPTLFYRVKLLP